MGLMVRDGVQLCALVLLQLVCVCQCYNGAPWRPSPGMHGGRKLELSKRALSNTDASILRSYLVHRDNGSNTTASERFLEAVKRSQGRVTQLEKNLQRTAQAQTAAATELQSTVSVGSGEYLMHFAVGTPAQQFIAVVDTGSDLCWVQCSPCTSCFQQPDALFNPTASSTYSQASCSNALCKALPESTCSRRNTCTYDYGYGDKSSTQGDLAYETVTLGATAVPHVGFGCGRNNQGTFSGADGLVGLGQGPLSLPSQLTPSVSKIFSYCLVEQLTENSDTSPITFGNAAAENANVNYTPLVANAINPTFYYVGVTGITIGGRAVTIPASAFRIASDGSGGVILDSGTTLTYWVAAAFDPILAAFRRQVAYPEVDASAYGLSLCYDVSGVSASFPAMVVRMANNVNFAIPAVNLFVAVDEGGTTFCLAMASADSFSIIGNIQQQNMLIVYDVVTQRVGFQTTQCNAL